MAFISKRIVNSVLFDSCEPLDCSQSGFSVHGRESPREFLIFLPPLGVSANEYILGN